jgi:chemotaxis protein histidine kinase CheA
MRALRSNDTLAAANAVIEVRAADLRGAVLDLIGRMKDAARAADAAAVYAAAHEVRGLAGTAGLAATGRIANGFCRYLDAIARHGLKPDADVLSLHLDAITRAARTEEDTARHGDQVARQLARLVTRRLARIKDSETP